MTDQEVSLVSNLKMKLNRNLHAVKWHHYGTQGYCSLLLYCMADYIQNSDCLIVASVNSSYLPGGFYHPLPESQIPPEKHPKHTKKH